MGMGNMAFYTSLYWLFSMIPRFAKANRPPGLQNCMILRLETWDSLYLNVPHFDTLCTFVEFLAPNAQRSHQITPDMLRLPRYWKLCEGQVPRSKTGPNLWSCARCDQPSKLMISNWRYRMGPQCTCETPKMLCKTWGRASLTFKYTKYMYQIYNIY